MQDQFAAAVESNDIIKSALEQMQDPPMTQMKHIDAHSEVCHVSGSMYLHLAREKYLMEAPYPIELLADHTAAHVLSECTPSSTTITGARKKKFSPFRVSCSTLKMKDNQQEEVISDQMDQIVLLSTDSNDVSGATYLNRSKINAFLEVIQSSAARKKFKTLIIGKLAECLNKLRELAHRSASESAAQQASIQMLQHEVANLQQKLKCSVDSSNNNDLEGGGNTAANSQHYHYRVRQFLQKIVDLYTEKQHENDQRQMTFLTQPLSSDMLITGAHTSYNKSSSSPDDRLCLADCGLNDEDLEQLLLKIVVSGVRFREIVLDSNCLSDIGAQHVADFLEKSPATLRVVSLAGNKRITRRGFDAIKRGLLRHKRVQRVQENELGSQNGVVLCGLALEPDFEESGSATEVFRVVLPVPYQEAGENLRKATAEDVDAMTDKLRQLGFRYKSRNPSASSRQRPTSYSNKTRVTNLHSQSYSGVSTARPAVNSDRRASLPSSSGTRKTPAFTSNETSASRRRSLPTTGGIRNILNSQRQQIKQQQDFRFQSLEAAIRRASAPQFRHQASHPSSSSRGNTVSSNNRRIFAKAHINTIRGLRR
ncbi:unnamed protein product [Phytophthora fragariaefolia]|uniref:Unnamed protein product n=1 Tax=Phytophthora fragariaefolia TaxID=1490495 RepID=A0A9W6UBU1_9STRA|nr:unnamed protein product [Phytophthora fragariaefolia]